jgi:hypothetical protein
MVRHALRTLVKNGFEPALELLGYTTRPNLRVEEFSCTPSNVQLGNHIELAATFTSASDQQQQLVVDFVVHHVNAAGGTSPKVFKWKTIALDPAAGTRITKRRLIQNASTRTYYAGPHRVELQVAGKIVATTQFHVELGTER